MKTRTPGAARLRTTLLCSTLLWPLATPVLSYAASACLARILPLSAADAVIVATLPAFIFYTVAILWAFACRDALVPGHAAEGADDGVGPEIFAHGADRTGAVGEVYAYLRSRCSGRAC
mgnify:CR=1 FL=1